jgi:quercetin dioxygenase-like cupin family protein
MSDVVLRRLRQHRVALARGAEAHELIRMGSCLNVQGSRSDDPREPSLDVGTVKLFENERVRVWDMCVPTGGRTGFHKHTNDYIFMQIGDGLCTTQKVDPATGEVYENPGISKVPAKSCTWIPASEEAPAIHQLFNASADTNYRQILVEFLELKPELNPKQCEARLQTAVRSTFVGTELLFENERCRVWDFSLLPHSGQDLDWHHHTLDYFFVNCCGGPNSPGEGRHGLTGWATPAMKDTIELFSDDRDCAYIPVTAGFDDHGDPHHIDKVWNHLTDPYESFIVELK